MDQIDRDAWHGIAMILVAMAGVMILLIGAGAAIAYLEQHFDERKAKPCECVEN